jgi:hypothetical protein
MAKNITGLEAKTYISSDYTPSDPPVAGDVTTATWTEVPCVRDETITLPAGTADFSCRGTRIRKRRATLQDWGASMQFVWDSTNTALTSIRDAYLNGTEVGLMFLDDAQDATAAEGPAGNWAVTGFNHNRPLEDGVLVDVEVVHSDGGQWAQLSTP